MSEDTSPETTAPATAPERASTPQGRAAALAARMQAEAPQPVDDTPEQEASPPAAAEPSSPDLDAATARRERLAALNAEAERRARASKERSQAERAAKELAEAKARLAEYEAERAAYSDPERVLQQVEKLGLAPEKLAEYLSGSLSDPTSHAAKSLVEKATKPLEEKLAAYEEKLAAIEAEKTKADAARAEQEAAQYVLSVATSPHLAQMRAQVGDAALLEYAEQMRSHPRAQGVTTFEELADLMEENLYAQGLYQPQPASPQPAKPPAKAPATTLTNALATQRETGPAGDEADGPRPSLAERSARARKLAAMGRL